MKILRLATFLLSSMMIILLCFLFNSGQAQVTLTEEEWVLPSYPIGAPDKNPSFFKNESYQGASRHFYPYTLNDNFSNEKIDKAWKALFLENEYIKLCVTPEIGGKIYYASDKTNEYNFLYKNDVVKPANIGMTGAWVSGGIEWNVLHHHRASSFLPVDYELVENEDGSKTIWVGETEQRHRMRWTIGITAFPGKSYFQAEIKIHNPTPYTQSFLYWANVATHTNKNYQAIFPPSVQVATYHTKNDFTHWPISRDVYLGQDFTQGVDISFWKNVLSPNSFFVFDLQEDFMGGYDHGTKSGTVHIGDHNIVKGAKLWEWGSGPLGQMIEAQLNESAGPYVELMVGAFSNNQPDYSWIRPYEVKTAKQYWYPIKDIGGFKFANLNGAVNLEQQDDNKVFLGYYSTQLVEEARITLKHKGEVILDKSMVISPEKTYTETLEMEGLYDMTDLYTEMVNVATGEKLVSYKPIKLQYDEVLPDPFTPAKAPKDIKTVEELYLTGSRIDQFYNPGFNALDYYEEALIRDPGDIRTHTAVGNIFLKNGDYANARNHFGKAIKRLTKDYTRPSDCEALYLQGVVLKALGLYDEAVDTLYRATWDYAFHSAAYLELARISIIQNDFEKALFQVNESISTNAKNNSALNLKVAIIRHLGQSEESTKTLKSIANTDPLDMRAANESHLLTRSSGNHQKVQSALDGFMTKMRDSDQNYLELAIAYLNDGLLEEAEDVLLRFRGQNPIINYYLGYLNHQKEDAEAAKEYFDRASAQSVDYVFPFRLETISVLQTALEYNGSDSKAHYYLGNILFEKQPEKAMEFWQNAIEDDPQMAIAHRNLGWAHTHFEGNLGKAIMAYEKAIMLDNTEAIYYAELDKLYETNNSPLHTRVGLFDGQNEFVSKREDAFARQISVLTLAGRAEEAVDYLSNKQFTFNEGSQENYDIISDAHLMLALKYLEKGQHENALESLKRALVPKELAIRGKYGNKNIQVNYFMGQANSALEKADKARKHFQICTELESRNSGYISYYLGLGHLQLGNKSEADKIFNSLITEGEEKINELTDGVEEKENAKLSNAYLLKGLGHKGLGDNQSGRDNLRKSNALSISNLVAKVELENE